MPPEGRTWLLLIHQIPPEPGYTRVKIGRRLQRIGAVSIKNSVYVLPHGNQELEDLQWIAKEIESGGGEASLCQARFVAGLNDAQVVDLFHQARNADYAAIAEEGLRLAGGPLDSGAAVLRRDFARLRRRLAEAEALDFFQAPGKSAAVAALLGLESAVRDLETSRGEESVKLPISEELAALRGRVWVTRADVHVDRMASAWLIRRFVDPQARFKFVSSQEYRPGADEVRFDMFEAEFTHQGDACTFEVLLKRLGLADPALAALAEIVHDIDLKDGKFGRPETEGLDQLIAGIILGHPQDEARLERSQAVLDDFYSYLRQVPKAAPKAE